MIRIGIFFVFLFSYIQNTSSLYAYTMKELLCRTSECLYAKISPDGKLLAKIGADAREIANITIVDLEQDVAEEQLTFFTNPNIIQFFWSADSKKILLLKEENGTGRLDLYGFDVLTKKETIYTKLPDNIGAKVLKVGREKNQAMIGLYKEKCAFYDLYLLDLDTEQVSLACENTCYAKFLLSENLDIILKMQIHENGSWSVFLENNDLFFTLSKQDAFQTDFISYNSSEKLVYFLDNRFSNTNQLTQKSVVFPYEERILGHNDASDIDEVLFSNNKLRAYASYYTQKKWHILDSSIKKDLDFLAKHVGTNFSVVSQNKKGDKWIVSTSIPDQGMDF